MDRRGIRLALSSPSGESTGKRGYQAVLAAAAKPGFKPVRVPVRIIGRAIIDAAVRIVRAVAVDMIVRVARPSDMERNPSKPRGGQGPARSVIDRSGFSRPRNAKGDCIGGRDKTATLGRRSLRREKMSSVIASALRSFRQSCLAKAGSNGYLARVRPNETAPAERIAGIVSYGAVLCALRRTWTRSQLGLPFPVGPASRCRLSSAGRAHHS